MMNKIFKVRGRTCGIRNFSFTRSIRTNYQQCEGLDTVYTPPDLSQIDKQWTTKKIKISLKEEIQEYLVWKMGDDWKNMATDDIKAAYYISYGKWGPRGDGDTLMNNPIYVVLKSTFTVLLFAAIGVSVINLRNDKKIMTGLEGINEN